MKLEPMKPAPPVMRMFMCYLFLYYLKGPILCEYGTILRGGCEED
jgi:hypothetical protein